LFWGQDLFMALLSSLKRALTVHFLLVGSVPVLLFGLVSIELIAERQLKGVRERNIAQARAIAEEVDAFLTEVRSDLQHVQQTIAAETILRTANTNQFLAGMVRNSQFFESIYLLDEDMHVLHLGVLPELEARQDDYANIDLSGHRLFRAKKDIRGPVWSNTFVSLVTGEPSVTLGMPMPRGFLLGNIRLSSLGMLLQRYSQYGGAEVAIIDKGGTLIAHNTVELAMQRISFANHPSVLRAMDGEDSTEEVALDRQNYLESATQVKTSSWIIWVGLNMDRVNAPIRNMRSILIFFMLIAVALASIIALFNVRRLMRPLTDLGLKTDQIADGHYDFQFQTSGFSEIDALAGQIRSMSHAIKVREESIITNEKRFRDLVNSIDGIVWEMDYPSLRVLFVSRQAEQLLGYTAQDWYEDSSFWGHKIHPDDVEQAMTHNRLMTEQLEDHSFECRMITEDGHILWIRNLVTVIVEDKRPVRMLGVMIDVTTQKELLDELRRSEENYREIFNGTSDAIFIHDAANGEILDVNQAMLNMYGCSYDDALTGDIGKFSKGVSPYTVDEAKLKLQKAVAHGSCSFEWVARKQSGEFFWVDVNLRSAMIGNQHRVLASVRDISSRKQAVEQLREANERLSLLINRMPIGCILWSSQFTVNMWNPTAERIFGFTVAEMMDKKPYGTIVPEDMRPLIEPVWQKIMTGDRSAHSVNENITKQGKTITCEWYNTPVLDASGEITGAISMVQDISQRKAAEDELEKYRSTLEELVRERSAQLEAAQAELVQKERLAVLGQLTATVSHEIRNPLGTIANSLYLLRESLRGGENASLDKPLLLAERNVERCDTIISDLLDFSRQRRIEKTVIKIDDWLTELLEEMNLPGHIQLQKDLSVASVIPFDPERLRRAFINVINNALQALNEVDKSDKKLLVGSRLVEETCEIIVQDNGPGMSQDVVSRIFEPMFSTKNFGVGLGVPIIKNILEGHCGGVEYLSEVGKGTTVIMRLPLTENTCEQDV